MVFLFSFFYNIKINDLQSHFHGIKYITYLDHQDGKGTHWVTCHVNRNEKYYFNSFGLPPPGEIVSFLGQCKDSIVYNTSQIQGMTESICGHLCLMILYRLNHGSMFL